MSELDKFSLAEFQPQETPQSEPAQIEILIWQGFKCKISFFLFLWDQTFAQQLTSS